MATFKERANGHIQVLIRREGHPKQSKTFRTRTEAQAWARLVESEMDRGVFLSRAEAERTTLYNALERYQREVVPGKKSQKQEISKVNILKDSPLAAMSLASIHGADVANWRDQRGKAVAPATVGRELAVLSHLFTIARKEWGMEGLANPVEAVRKPKLPKARERRLEPGELDKLLAATGSVELGAIIVLALETAMRRGEIVGLQRENIDLKRRIAFLPDTKNGEARAVPLSQHAVNLLASLPASLDGRVFGMAGDSITQAFDRACRRAGIANLRFHDLRHEATSRLFESGNFDMMEVASITGHKTLSMLKRYTHLRAEDLAKKMK